MENHAVVAACDGGRITSDAGALLLGATNRVVGLTQRMANPRVVLTSLSPAEARHLYEEIYCASGRWKTGSRNASATCSPTATMQGNQVDSLAGVARK